MSSQLLGFLCPSPSPGVVHRPGKDSPSLVDASSPSTCVVTTRHVTATFVPECVVLQCFPVVRNSLEFRSGVYFNICCSKEKI